MSDKTKSRYIIAMEIGNENEANGISYEQLLKEMEIRLNYKLSKNAECAFIRWFIQNFSQEEKIADTSMDSIYHYSRVFVKDKHGEKIADENLNTAKSTLNKIIYSNSFLNGDADKKYIDYLELVEARQSSKEAIRKANTSIRIAYVTIIISIIFSMLNIFTQPKLPYDVNVLNQAKTITDLDSIKNELNEIKTLIKFNLIDSTIPNEDKIK